MNAELLEYTQVPTFGQQPHVEFTQHHRESIRILEHIGGTAPRHAEQIREVILPSRDEPFMQTGRMQ